MTVQVCFDCGNKNPKWASATIGIFLCYNCTTTHRKIGASVSFVRSINMDRWKEKHLIFMEQGGNQRAREYYTKHGMMKGATPNHEDPKLAKYKDMVQAEVDRILGTREPMEAPKVEPVAKVEAPPVVQEEVKQTGFLVMQKEDSSKVYGFSNV